MHEIEAARHIAPGGFWALDHDVQTGLLAWWRVKHPAAKKKAKRGKGADWWTGG